MHTPFNGKTWKKVNTDTLLEGQKNIELIIDVVATNDVTIQFANESSSEEVNWDNTRNTYYDEEFKAIRGELYLEKTGTDINPDEPYLVFDSHFIIFYTGKSGPRGYVSQLFLNFYKEKDIDTPTFNLIHRLSEIYPKELVSHRGSWKADN